MTSNTGMGVEQDERDLEPEETDEYLESAEPATTTEAEESEEAVQPEESVRRTGLTEPEEAVGPEESVYRTGSAEPEEASYHTELTEPEEASYRTGLTEPEEAEASETELDDSDEELEPEASRDSLAAPYIGPGPVAAPEPAWARESEPEAVAEPEAAFEPTPDEFDQPVLDTPVPEHSARMNEIQLAFIDDPRRAAQDADSLVDDLLRGLTADLARRRTELGGEILRSDSAETVPHTEELRLAVQQSRDLIDLLAQARDQVRI
jgi:hypothetical protein